LAIVTKVDLYRDNAAVAGQMSRTLNDLRLLAGKRLRGGAILERGATFRPRRIADATIGLTYTTRARGFNVYVTRVGFRHGRLLAAVSEARADSTNVNATVVSFARTLEARITGVLSGENRVG
jgi:hypothetical protein